MKYKNMNITIDVTSKCNLRCKHCRLNEIEKDNNYKKDYNFYLTKGKVLYYLGKFEESKNELNKGLQYTI